MIFQRTTVCPYCGVKTKLQLHFKGGNRNETKIINCAPEDGGCDKEYVLKVKYIIDVEHSAYAIPGLYGEFKQEEAAI